MYGMKRETDQVFFVDSVSGSSAIEKMSEDGFAFSPNKEKMVRAFQDAVADLDEPVIFSYHYDDQNTVTVSAGKNVPSGYDGPINDFRTALIEARVTRGIALGMQYMKSQR